MNDQINKLFGEALDSAVPETWTTLTPEQLCRFKTKFAELIVRECLSVQNKCPHNIAPGQFVRKHFGVK